MEKEKSGQLKKILLVVFVLISVGLIVMIWSAALLDRESDGPGFYRATAQVDYTFYLTQTAKASKGTIAPTKLHKSENAASTPVLSITLTPTLTEGVDQEN